MTKPIDNLNALVTALHMTPVDFEKLYAGMNNLTPLGSVELFLLEQQRLRLEKQNLLRRKHASLPAEKNLIRLISVFSAVFPRSKCSVSPI